MAVNISECTLHNAHLRQFIIQLRCNNHIISVRKFGNGKVEEKNISQDRLLTNRNCYAKESCSRSVILPFLNQNAKLKIVVSWSYKSHTVQVFFCFSCVFTNSYLMEPINPILTLEDSKLIRNFIFQRIGFDSTKMQTMSSWIFYYKKYQCIER